MSEVVRVKARDVQLADRLLIGSELFVVTSVQHEPLEVILDDVQTVLPAVRIDAWAWKGSTWKSELWLHLVDDAELTVERDSV